MLYIGKGNAIFAWYFKDAHYMWGQNLIPTLWFESTLYIGEREIQYLHDNLKMHIVCKWQNAILALWP
jgi:hypothetical protein